MFSDQPFLSFWWWKVDGFCIFWEDISCFLPILEKLPWASIHGHVTKSLLKPTRPSLTFTWASETHVQRPFLFWKETNTGKPACKHPHAPAGLATGLSHHCTSFQAFVCLKLATLSAWEICHSDWSGKKRENWWKAPNKLQEIPLRTGCI